jgi:hypothetical protein
MNTRYRLFLRRKSVYYAFDNTTKTFESLKTKDKAEANRLLMAMNEAGHQPAMNLSLARVYCDSDSACPARKRFGSGCPESTTATLAATRAESSSVMV